MRIPTNPNAPPTFVRQYKIPIASYEQVQEIVDSLLERVGGGGQLEQGIPKNKASTILSTLDVASGFWTIPVHPDDQQKLAFTFDNQQYTFTRCPFGYANSPAEFNIFLKACPDARGYLIYVDDVVMKSSSVEDHLKEIDHVLNQQTTA